jgi:multiple sugar transport system ATP-binding protein
MMDLHVENLEKRFGERLAVEIPRLTIRAGEFFTFVGPSGCGKSTTLNLIAGLEEATRGTLRLGERVLDHLPPHRRDVAFVFQSYALYPHRSVFGNLAFPLELAGVAREEIRRRVRAAAEMLGLVPLLEKRPRQLSGGERQRVALGRAIVRQPRLFLFDEPLSNLDAPLRAQMRRELKRLHRELGTTFIYVTHDQEEALSLSDRIAVMRDARIQQCGTPREIYDAPANVFVAAFFGAPPINLVEGAVTLGSGGAEVRVGGTAALPLPEGTAARLPAGARATLGVRPEHVRVSRAPQPGAWPAAVAMAELHGGHSYLELDCEGFSLTAVERADAAFLPGEQVWVAADSQRVLWFDAATGERIAG